jgi:hypothetical protein
MEAADASPAAHEVLAILETGKEDELRRVLLKK